MSRCLSATLAEACDRCVIRSQEVRNLSDSLRHRRADSFRHVAADEFAAMGVFHLALGGEALMSPNFAPVARAARQHGIVPNVTTNSWLITESLLDEVGDNLGELQARGVAGCAMGERFATIKWNGDVSPCSHLHGEEFKAGNVVHECFRAIWERGEVFANLRRDLQQVEGKCGSCQHKAFCKGCCAVMQEQTGNWLEEDQDCSVTSR